MTPTTTSADARALDCAHSHAEKIGDVYLCSQCKEHVFATPPAVDAPGAVEVLRVEPDKLRETLEWLDEYEDIVSGDDTPSPCLAHIVRLRRLVNAALARPQAAQGREDVRLLPIPTAHLLDLYANEQADADVATIMREGAEVIRDLTTPPKPEGAEAVAAYGERLAAVVRAVLATDNVNMRAALSSALGKYDAARRATPAAAQASDTDDEPPVCHNCGKQNIVVGCLSCGCSAAATHRDIAQASDTGRGEAIDPVLANFYQVDNATALIAAQAEHIEQLQRAAIDNVKPWEDTFPRTLTPKWLRDNGYNPTEDSAGKDGDYLFTTEDVNEAMGVLYRQRSAVIEDALRQMEQCLLDNADDAEAARSATQDREGQV